MLFRLYHAINLYIHINNFIRTTRLKFAQNLIKNKLIIACVAAVFLGKEQDLEREKNARGEGEKPSFFLSLVFLSLKKQPLRRLAKYN